MESQTESLWLIALASKCTAFSPQTILFLFTLLCLASLTMVLFHWVEPEGPAWGNYRHKFTPRNTPVLPPGPRGYPIIGSMDLMVGLAHHKLTSMANLLGARRLMAFSMGDTRVVITCNPDVAKDILCNSVFADRPIKESAYSLMFNRAMGFAPYGVYWRTLRRIASTHMFCPKQINLGVRQRAEIASQMVNMINNNVGKNTAASAFSVREMLKLASLTNMMESVFGRRYELSTASHNSKAAELSQLVQEGYDLLGKLNLSDHFSWLGSFDPQRIRERCSQLVPRVNRFVNRIISEHRVRDHKHETGDETSHDFVDVLLSLNGPDKLSDSDMVAVLWEMIFRGTDTVAVLIEWILARMVLHPDIQSKVQIELDKVIGKSRPLMESDIPSLGYLQAMIKEVLRLHPPGPLLSWARLSITDTTLDGYHIPAGTTAMVNMWAIARDPDIWADPLRFYPERFIGKMDDFSVLGSDLRLAPFGSGRRSCPGKALGLTTVTYWVGTLLHEFVWTQCDQNPVTLNEVMKLSCEMANPLKVMVHSRRN
ncbi:cytochrome P450 78A9-like [Chenopodium quinoa]|uniref:Uncharacterized protein n=1 Tax=Chenopodium quinoa TaxID=63459 RepID=A0A803LWR8_CHEQI|nr:cytochrome P450 78A9-like [Chenopodium quinoa]